MAERHGVHGEETFTGFKWIGRIATEPVELCGQTIAAGTWVRVMTAAVGRDPALHTEPDRFAIDREHREHLAFGGGSHHCLGAHLGRSEARIALRQLLERYPEIRLAEGDDDAVAMRRGVPGFRGFERVMCAFADRLGAATLRL